MHYLGLAIDAAGPVAQVQLDSLLAIPIESGEHELFGVAMGEERREPHAVVGRPRLFAKRNDLKAACRIELDKLFAKAVPDHTVADHDDFLALWGRNHGFPPVATVAVGSGLNNPSTSLFTIGVLQGAHGDGAILVRR